MNNHDLWVLIQSAYNSDFKYEFLPNTYYSYNIESYDNWYRVDTYRGDNSISLKILREYSIVHSSCEYKLELMKNGRKYRQTQKELIWKIINQEFLPLFRDIKINQLI